MLDLSSLEAALDSLDSAISISVRTQADEAMRRVLRAGVIQNFEFTYELSWKMIRRWIRANVSPEDADPRTRKDLFRLAARERLVDDPMPWFDYANARNITSHVYDDAKAKEVYETTLRFADDARRLLDALKQSNDD